MNSPVHILLASLEFELPKTLRLGLPVVLLIVFVAAFALWKHRLSKARIATLAALRAAVLLIAIALLARPMRVEKPPPVSARRPVALLIDRSESMSLDEGGTTRFQKVREFVQRRLMPALKDADLPVRVMTFAQGAEPRQLEQLVKTLPDGKRTNLGAAIAEALGGGDSPLAIIACTDGAANELADNPRALSMLAESRVPFIGVGFGSDQGTQTLSLRQADAPTVVPPKTDFNVSAYLEAMNLDGAVPFDLVLLRDGAMVQQKSVRPGVGSRVWLESFRVSETDEGIHQYSVQLLPPTSPSLKCVSRVGTVSVRIRTERELRVLFVQGALTWDYKFISLALKSDPSIKVTGLTRTSKESIFRQNVESSAELLRGFPTTVEELSPFRVVVLSNLKPTDLTSIQQELLGRFCSELGGGLLMIGAGATFDQTWRSSRLEQMLPVVFANDSGVRGLDRAFRLQLTEDALQNPVFQITNDGTARQAWFKIPTFTQYARVDTAKPGAQVWAVHSQDSGPKGRRILMASQRYGAGQTAVMCVQNFWRWRLAKDAEPQQFDRFWRQFFRLLAESRREDVAIQIADQDLRPQSDVQITLEKQPNPLDAVQGARKFTARIETQEKKLVREETVELKSGRPVDMSFRAETAGLYTISVRDEAKEPVVSRSIEIREVNLEFQNTGRNMEILRQWAALSGGLAVKVEDCRDPAELVAEIKKRMEQARQSKALPLPVGINVWTLSALLSCLGAEWLFRKRWGLV